MRTKSILLFLAAALFASALPAQTLTLTGPATARPGQTISVNVALASPPASLAATQWSITLPAGYVATGTAGAASTLAAKTLYCNTLSTTCLTVGINTNLYAAGVVATYSLVVPTTAAPGPVTIPLSGVVGATLAGDAAVLNAGTAYAFSVLPRTDLNGDGKVDILDLQLMIQEILVGSIANDQNGDGVANIRDVQIVARAAVGGSASIPAQLQFACGAAAMLAGDSTTCVARLDQPAPIGAAVVRVTVPGGFEGCCFVGPTSVTIPTGASESSFVLTRTTMAGAISPQVLAAPLTTWLEDWPTAVQYVAQVMLPCCARVDRCGYAADQIEWSPCA